MIINTTKTTNIILGGLKADSIAVANGLTKLRFNIKTLKKDVIDSFTVELQDLINVGFLEDADILEITNS